MENISTVFVSEDSDIKNPISYTSLPYNHISCELNNRHISWSCATCKDSDQPVYLYNLIRIFTGHKDAKFLHADIEDNDQIV